MTDLANTKKRRGVTLYESNPFVMTAQHHTRPGVRRVSSKGDRMMVVSETTGEIIAPAGFWQYQEVDRTEFVKLYVNGVKAFKQLTSAGTKVFELFYLQVQRNVGSDRVFLSFHAIDQALTPMSEATYTRGMRELVDKKFIAPTVVQGWFFSNPDYVWNGDRLAFIKEYRVAGTQSSLDEQGQKTALEANGQQRLPMNN